MVSQSNKRPKVVMFSTVHSATDSRIFHKEARSLSLAGYDVVVVACACGDALLHGVQIRALTRATSRVKRAAGSLRLFRMILRERAKVHHFHDPELIPLGVLLRILGKKVIYDAHEDVPEDILSKRYLPGWLRTLVRAAVGPVERWASRRMSAVIAATEGIARRLHGATVARNYAVLAHVRQVFDVTTGRGRSEPFVVYFGTITRDVGIREMVAAVARVSQAYPIRLRLLGAFEDDALRSEILDGGAREVIDYGGFVPMPQVYERYKGALGGLLVLHPVKKLMCSLPIKMFECMACGVPLIASDFPLWREIIYDQGCGLVVNPLDVQEIANAIIYLVQNRAEAEKMGRKGIELAQTKYNWEKESCRLLRVYRRLLARGEGAPPPARKQSG